MMSLRRRYMVVGDSLAVGTPNDIARGGWREVLVGKTYNSLPWKSVGGQSSGNFGENRMCGQAGQTVTDLATKMLEVAPQFLSNVVGDEPDPVVLIHAGTNDCTQLNSGGSPLLATSMASYTNLLNYIRNANATARVYAALIIDNQTAHTQVVAFNSALTTLIQARTDYASGYLKIVDMYAALGLYSGTYWADGTHLNTAGYKVKGTAWTSALTADGL